MADAIRELQKEWSVISNAPWLFTAALAVIGSLLWYLMRWINSAEMSGLREQNRLKDLRLTEQDRLIRELRPTDTAYSRLSNTALKQRAERLVIQLRSFYQREQGFSRDREEALRFIAFAHVQQRGGRSTGADAPV